MMTSHEWRVLSTYESSDILIRLYALIHGGSVLSPERASDIAAWFAQGREYFAAAEASGPLVRPLLQYYGVLGLARGTILLLNDGSNHGLKESHGLKAKDWTNTLRTKAGRPTISFKVEDGTFLSLAKATKNRDTYSYHHQFHLNGRKDQEFPLAGLPGASFSMKDTLARIADIGPVFQRCMNERPCAAPASLSIVELDGAFLSMSADTEVPHEALMETFGLRDPWTPRGHMSGSHCFMITNDMDWAAHMPHMEELGDASHATIAAYPNGLHLSRLLRIHLLSAFLGTFARYHPEPWMIAVHGHADGDHIMPLIRAAMNLVDQEYPRLIVQEIERQM